MLKLSRKRQFPNVPPIDPTVQKEDPEANNKNTALRLRKSPLKTFRSVS